MQLDDSYLVTPRGGQQEHPCAAPENIDALIDAISESPAPLEALAGHHLVSLNQFQAPHLAQLFRSAALLEQAGRDRITPFSGCILASTFIDDFHARAQQSFDNAFLRLGGNVMHFGDRLGAPEDNASVLGELASMCNNYADVAVVRTLYDDSLGRMLSNFRIPVISAGNGVDEHPSNAMADLYTLLKWRPTLLQQDPAANSGLEIAILSTPSESRNVSSFLLALTRFPQVVKRIVVMGRSAQPFRPGQRELLEQAGIRIDTDIELYPNLGLLDGLKEILPRSDVIYADRVRTWSMSRQDMLAGMAAMKEDALVLHPQLRDVTISENLDHSVHNGYFAQERNAIYVRMALFLAVLGINS